MSNLIDHANREFDLLGFPKPTRAEMRSNDVPHTDDGWNMAIRRSTMQIIEQFAKQGHSGGSAAQAISIVHRLLQFKPLSPLTDDPAEWHKVAEELTSGEDLWQSRRNPEAFSHDEGKTFYFVGQYTKFGKWARRLPKSKLRGWVWKHRSWMHEIHNSVSKKLTVNGGPVE